MAKADSGSLPSRGGWTFDPLIICSRTASRFSWEGQDERDHACGRGWAVVTKDGELTGRIFLHLGDDSAFRAVRE